MFADATVRREAPPRARFATGNVTYDLDANFARYR
ncbi:hypothetical protein DFJ69_0624 [Thermomonospora umbrina]|uniref:Uncharacterized protein n=1 Tax=Thermomonospora umbrina TaxID=111806 RepID=A0A3D9SU75_9ACTN|nr:hypothetical protein DFJ69_0624 [Thermomonospora umbrina]